MAQTSLPTKNSFFHRLGSSFRSKSALLALASTLTFTACSSGKQRCAADYDCPGEELCIENVCTSSCKSDYDCPGEEICEENTCRNANNREVSGAFIKSGETNPQGEAYFWDTQSGEEVIVSVEDDHSHNPLAKAKVTFIDGEGFEGYALTLEDYVSHFEVFPHNSRRNFRMVRGRYTQANIFEFYQDQHPRQVNALDNYAEWAKRGGYVYKGCKTKEELREGRRTSMALLSLGGYSGAAHFFQIIGTVLGKIIDLEDLGIINNLPDDVYQIYEPLNFTSPLLIEGHPLSEEILGNNLDDDCDGLIDERAEPSRTLGVSLAWDTRADIDLHIYAPNNCHIDYTNKECGGGRLEEDIIPCGGESSRSENVTWNGNPPRGEYRVEVHYYNECSQSGRTNYTVTITNNDRGSTFNGALDRKGDRIRVTSFRIN